MTEMKKVYTVYSTKLSTKPGGPVLYQDLITYFDKEKADRKARERINTDYIPSRWVVGIMESYLDNEYD